MVWLLMSRRWGRWARVPLNLVTVDARFGSAIQVIRSVLLSTPDAGVGDVISFARKALVNIISIKKYQQRCRTRNVIQFIFTCIDTHTGVGCLAIFVERLEEPVSPCETSDFSLDLNLILGSRDCGLVNIVRIIFTKAKEALEDVGRSI